MFLTTSDSANRCTWKKRGRHSSTGIRPYNLSTIHMTNQVRLQEFKREKRIERQRLIEQSFEDVVAYCGNGGQPLIPDIDDWYVYNCYFPHDPLSRQSRIFDTQQHRRFTDRIQNRKTQFHLFTQYLLKSGNYDLRNSDLVSDNNRTVENCSILSSSSCSSSSSSSSYSSSLRSSAKKNKKNNTKPTPFFSLEDNKSDTSSKSSKQINPSSVASCSSSSVRQSLLFVLSNESLLMRVVRDLERGNSIDVDSWEKQRIAISLRKLWWLLTKETTDFEESVRKAEIIFGNVYDILIECKRCRLDSVLKQIHDSLRNLLIIPACLQFE